MDDMSLLSYALFIAAFIISLAAQGLVDSAFRKYSKVMNRRGMSGAEAARAILDANGLQNVQVVSIGGQLTDHYDPRANQIRLSDSVYSMHSVAALGVAAHECGHAIQHSVGYTPIKIRSAVIPATQIGSKLAVPLVVIGLFLRSLTLVDIGILLYCLVVLFQLITLPVEFDASRRALATLEGMYFLEDDEMKGAKKVLRAAALTYVAALLSTVISLFRLLVLRGNRRR